MPPEILHLDDALVIVNKPAGLPSVPGRAVALHDCMASRLQVAVPDALVVHRLDMATSGLLAFGRGPAAQRRLSRSFAERSVRKRYVAVVEGCVAADEGEIDLPLIADWPNRPRQKVDLAAGKPSLTRFRVIERHDDRTRLALEPVTGRSHQIRVHLLAMGHPILGDTLYAPRDTQQHAARLLLHATNLWLPHPQSGEQLGFHSEAPF